MDMDCGLLCDTGVIERFGFPWRLLREKPTPPEHVRAVQSASDGQAAARARAGQHWLLTADSRRPYLCSGNAPCESMQQVPERINLTIESDPGLLFASAAIGRSGAGRTSMTK